MSDYKFKLQKLLDIRISNEEDSIRNFQSKKKDKNEVEQKLNRFKEDYSKYCNVSNTKNLAEQKVRYSYLRVLDNVINDTTVELSQKEEALLNSMEELKTCQIERKTVEILKEKGKTAYMKEQALIEQKINDEFALYSYMRNSERG